MLFMIDCKKEDINKTKLKTIFNARSLMNVFMMQKINLIKIKYSNIKTTM